MITHTHAHAEWLEQLRITVECSVRYAVNDVWIYVRVWMLFIVVSNMLRNVILSVLFRSVRRISSAFSAFWMHFIKCRIYGFLAGVDILETASANVHVCLHVLRLAFATKRWMCGFSFLQMISTLSLSRGLHPQMAFMASNKTGSGCCVVFIFNPWLG